MTDTRIVGTAAGLDLAAPRPAAGKPAACARRRLPVQKDWPTWALIGAQIGILVGAVSLWEIGARAGWIDAFFWSQPSAIAHTMGIFFTTGDAWTDIGFTFRSTIFGFGIGLVSKVAVATALTLVVSTLTAYAGVKALDPDGEKLFYSLGATRMQVFRKLV